MGKTSSRSLTWTRQSSTQSSTRRTARRGSTTSLQICFRIWASRALSITSLACRKSKTGCRQLPPPPPIFDNSFLNRISNNKPTRTISSLNQHTISLIITLLPKHLLMMAWRTQVSHRCRLKKISLDNRKQMPQTWSERLQGSNLSLSLLGSNSRQWLNQITTMILRGRLKML